MERLNNMTRIQMEQDLSLLINKHFKDIFHVNTRPYMNGQWKVTLLCRFPNMDVFKNISIITNDEDKVDNNGFDFYDVYKQIDAVLCDIDDDDIINIHDTLTRYCELGRV